MMDKAVVLAERGLVPDSVLRLAMRRLIRRRAESAAKALADGTQDRFIEACGRGPVAVATARANEQHYEVPAAFFVEVLGPHLKYSCAWFETGRESLADAEAAMLARTSERAGLGDGMRILELGCGWGALTLWMASHYPNATIEAVSNSTSQRVFIEACAAERGLGNVRVHTADINHFRPDKRFDRIVSVEMFEHVRNHALLFRRLRDWITDDGRIFVHVFCHAHYAYPFESRGPGDWMAEHFFTGGMMPSYGLLPAAARDFTVEAEWTVSGLHYAKTCEAWLTNLDLCAPEMHCRFAEAYGPDNASRWVQRWRMFFMACAELFRHNDGKSWHVAQYRFAPRPDTDT